MKRYIWEFLRRGLIACGLGPLVLAILYWILHQSAVIETLSVNEVCTGIVSLSVLAFLAGGMNVLYQIERLPLIPAVFIHGSVLYIGYLATYLVNGWLMPRLISVLVFTGIFIVGYFVVWAIIYRIIKRNTKEINEMLRQKQSLAETE